MCKKFQILMEIICNQNELNNAIQLVSKAVASRPTHPILANILLTADEGTNKISVTGFDLNLGIQTSFDGTVKISGAITCLLYTSPSPRDLSTSRMPSSA